MRAVLKSAALGFALLALLLRAALPDGWMPASAASAPLMPCPGMMAMPMTPAPHSGAPLHKHGSHTTICIFAAAGHFGSVPVPAPVPAPLGAVATAPQPFAAANFISRTSYRPNAARAPPLTV